VVGGFRLARTIARASMIAEVAGGRKLPEPTRAAAMMALLGIALLGMLLVVVILLGGHWVRRQGSHRRGRSVPPDRRPLVVAAPADQPIEESKAMGESPAADTVHDGDSHGETRTS